MAASGQWGTVLGTGESRQFLVGLQKAGAVTTDQMRDCKQRMNTFAYIGSVRDKPVVRCVYQTDISQNRFLTKGIADDTVGLTPEADQF